MKVTKFGTILMVDGRITMRGFSFDAKHEDINGTFASFAAQAVVDHIQAAINSENKEEWIGDIFYDNGKYSINHRKWYKNTIVIFGVSFLFGFFCVPYIVNYIANLF